VELKTGRILARLVGDRNDSPNQIDNEVPGDPTKTAFDSPLTGIPSVFPGGGRVAERLYVGDADGTMWRVELTSADPNEWEAHIAFDAYNNNGSESTLKNAWLQTTKTELNLNPNDNDAAEMGQPIQTAPLLSTDEEGNVVVTFATGNQESFNNVSSGAVNMLVSFTDTFTNSKTGDPEETTGFQARVDGSGANAKGVEMAWVDGGGVTGPINLFDGQLYFAYFNPSAANTCTLGTGGICGVDYVKRLSSGDPTPSGTADSTDPTEACGDFDNGEVVFGISLNLVPSCAVTTSSFSDPWMNGNYNAMTTANGGRYELVFHTGQNGGTPAGGGKTKRTKVELPQPKARTTVRSFVRVAETDQ
jgi:type IV pilus assembly protein PilY1